MRFATINEGRGESRLVIVSNDLTEMTDAGRIAPALGAALNDWSSLERPLFDLSESVEHRSVPLERFHERAALSPLPRAARRVAVKLAGETATCLEATASEFHAPRDVVHLHERSGDVALEVSLAAFLDALPAGGSLETAASAIRLVALVADFSSGSGKAVSLVSPVAVTPETLNAVGMGAQDRLPLTIDANSHALLRADATQVARSLPRIIVELAAGHAIEGGTVLTVSLATERLALGDVVRIDLRDASGRSLCGAIETRLARMGED